MARFRIMVVDDDPDVRFVVSSLLGLEFETTQASNGLDALEKIERHEPDMLLMDINMPVMNGIACCNRIQKQEQFEKIPVIFVSASSAAEVKQSATDAGGLAFFGKPFDTSMLIETINNHFREAKLEPSEKAFDISEIAGLDSTTLQPAAGWTFEKKAGPALGDDETGGGNITASEEDPAPKKRRTFGAVRKPVPPPAEVPTVEVPVPSSADLIPKTEEPERIPVELVDVPLPAPPTPDYGRISKEFSRKAMEDTLRRSSREVPLPKPDTLPAPPVSRQPAPEPPKLPPPPVQRPIPISTPPPPVDIRPPARPPVAPAATPPVAPARPPAVAPPAAPPRPTAPAVAQGPTAADILAERRRKILAKVGAGGPATAAGGPPSKPRVLAIIDIPAHVEMLADASKNLAEFLPLEDPVEALELIIRFQPDIVMMGITEKRYSGLSIGQMIRSNPRLAHIEVLFIQNAWTEPAAVNAAMAFSRNRIVRPPLAASLVRTALEEITRKPTFSVRTKSLSYGVYVKEVLKAAEAERQKINKHKAVQAREDHYQTLVSFMARELKTYKEPEGYDELKGVGNKVHTIGDE